ncbi:MAG: ATP-binding protein [Paludibacteraceae bacterium]
MIQRPLYLRQLAALKDQHLIKVITGVRRCGKSTLMQSFQQWLLDHGVSASHIVALNFEERQHSDYTNWQSIYDTIAKRITDTQRYYIFLDEVQQVPQFERLVDALFVRQEIDLYVTGSNAYLLSSELATLLSGRYVAIHLHPFSFSEYVACFPDERNTDRLFRQYLNTSCFPEAVNLQISAPQMVNTYLRSIYDTVVVKDIIQHFRLRKTNQLQALIPFIYDSIGSVVSANNIASAMQSHTAISRNTIQNMLDYLSMAYLLYPVRLYNIRGKRLLSNNYKYYVVDLGLRNILETNQYDTDLGHKLENVIYFELLRRSGEVYAGKSDIGEVDFVVKESTGQIAYYQVAFTVSDERTLARELAPLVRIRDANPKYLLTLDYDTAVIQGVRKINVVDWLLQ